MSSFMTRMLPVAALALLSLPAAADTVVLPASRDTSIYASSNTVSNGAGGYLFAGRDAAGSLKRALIHFDVAGAVPAQATITAATLTLQVSKSNNTSSRQMSLHAATADWGEAGSDGGPQGGDGAPAATGDATWQYRFFNTSQWTVPGGDFVAVADGSQTVRGIGSYTWSSAGLVDRVQGWLDSPASNFGWVLIGDESQQSARRFDSRSIEPTATRPTLTVEYTLAGAPLADPIPEPIAKSGTAVELITVASGFAAPIHLTTAPDGSGRLFVVDQAGLVRIIAGDAVADIPFLDLRSRLVSPLGVGGSHDENDYDERGLLGLAFHPGFADSGSPGFRCFYTCTSEPVAGIADFTSAPLPQGASFDHQAVVAEWQVDPADPNRAEPSTRREVLRIDQPQFNHNGGSLAFGPDGYLYIALGDGGGGNDTGAGHGAAGNGQNPDTVHGSLLRLDPLSPERTPESVDAVSANGHYRVPAANPFVAVAGVDEIFAYGLRNPFRFSFDRQTGALIVADVGQNNIEEIDLVSSGDNLGWNLKEGSFRFNPDNGTVSADVASLPSGLVDPLAEYDHDEGIAVIGGYVYRGSDLPALVGRYICGDLSATFASAAGRLFAVDLVGGTTTELPIGATDRPLDAFLKGFGEDADGELYLLVSDHLGPYGSGGSVLRLAAQPADLPPLTLVLDAVAVTEGGQISATVSRSLQDGRGALTLTIDLDLPNDASAPLTTTMAADSAATAFTVATVDDELVEGDETLSISVSAAGFRTAHKDVVIVDNDAPPPDSDNDGMPDDWETTYGLDPNGPADAQEDLDGDGLSNLQEFQANSDPSRYVLRLQPGWNDVSIARTPQDNSVAALFDQRVNPSVWVWENNRYTLTDRLLPLRGHWVYNRTAAVIEVEIHWP